jgi:hypothetical protein
VLRKGKNYPSTQFILRCYRPGGLNKMKKELAMVSMATLLSCSNGDIGGKIEEKSTQNSKCNDYPCNVEQGPKGEKGDQGIPGNSGLKGDQGPAGLDGICNDQCGLEQRNVYLGATNKFDKQNNIYNPNNVPNGDIEFTKLDPVNQVDITYKGSIAADLLCESVFTNAKNAHMCTSFELLSAVSYGVRTGGNKFTNIEESFNTGGWVKYRTTPIGQGDAQESDLLGCKGFTDTARNDGPAATITNKSFNPNERDVGVHLTQLPCSTEDPILCCDIIYE